MKRKNSVKELRKILDSPEKYPNLITIDDFFKYVGISKEHRSDFVFACILHNANKIIHGEI